MKVLVVVPERERKIGRFLGRALNEEGHGVDHAFQAAEGLQLAQSGAYGLMVLDGNLPDADGAQVCRELRQRGSQLPVLVANAHARDHAVALNAGADDCMVKPLVLQEFLARVRALVRRSAPLAFHRYGVIDLEPESNQFFLNGRSLSLTSREHAILRHLLQRAEVIVTRAELTAHIWETASEPDSNVIDVNVSRLREKLGELGWMIETVRGSGYRLRARERGR